MMKAGGGEANSSWVESGPSTMPPLTLAYAAPNSTRSFGANKSLLRAKRKHRAIAFEAFLEKLIITFRQRF